MAGPLPSANTPGRWVWVVLAVQLTLGLAYTAAELGQDAHRGIAYPVFLAAADRLGGSSSLLRVIPNEHPGAPCTAPDGIALVQLLQLALCGVAIFYWLRTRDATAPGPPALGAPAALAIAGLLLFDPLIAHFALSVMPDALAMAASLVFCGALSRTVIGDRARPRDAMGLAFAFAAASLLRPEKQYVLLCTALASAAAWYWIARQGLHDFTRLPARLGFAGALLALASAASVTTARSVFVDYGRPSQTSIVLHARVIFPHLGDVFDALPEDVQRRFSESDVAFYDRHVLNPGPVMARISGGDGAEAARLTSEMARTAWRERGGAIVFDTAKDWLENALPTLGFYPRLAALESLDVPGYRRLSRSDMLPWTHKLMTEHHPTLALTSLAVSGLVFVLLAVASLRRWRPGDAALDTSVATLLPWIPAIAFALANGAAFALHADAVSPRYTVAAHGMLLAAVYASVLGRRVSG
jgi:hypothetical protein